MWYILNIFVVNSYLLQVVPTPYFNYRHSETMFISV